MAGGAARSTAVVRAEALEIAGHAGHERLLGSPIMVQTLCQEALTFLQLIHLRHQCAHLRLHIRHLATDVENVDRQPKHSRVGKSHRRITFHVDSIERQ